MSQTGTSLEASTLTRDGKARSRAFDYTPYRHSSGETCLPAPKTRQKPLDQDEIR